MHKGCLAMILSLLMVVPLHAASLDEMEAQIDTLCATLVNVEMLAYPTLEMHDRLERVAKASQYSDALDDLITLSKCDETSIDAALVPYVEAYKPLYIALTQTLENYLVALKAYKRKNPSSPFLKVVDIADLMQDCTACPTKCTTCKGSKKCTTCRGRGVITESSGSSLGASTRRKCSPCGGTGVCKTCRDVPSICTTCKGRRRVIDEQALFDRMQKHLDQMRQQSARVFAATLNAREQTTRLAEDIKRINSSTFSSTNPEKVLEVLDALPEERQAATTWASVATLREVAVAMREEMAFMAPEKVRMRAEIETAITTAQSKETAEEALVYLLAPMARCATSEQFPALETAHEAYVQQWKVDRQAAAEALKTTFEEIEALPSLEERMDAIEDFLDRTCRLPEVHRRLKEAPIYDALKAEDEAALARVEALRKQATAALDEALAQKQAAEQQALAQEAEKTPWWLLPAIIGGIVILLYFAFSAVQMVAENKKQKAKEAQRQAALDSIRQTFARSKKHR